MINNTTLPYYILKKKHFNEIMLCIYGDFK